MEENFSGAGNLTVSDVFGTDAENLNASGEVSLPPGLYYIPGAEGYFYAGGRRKQCKAMGLKPKDCTKALRDAKWKKGQELPAELAQKIKDKGGDPTKKAEYADKKTKNRIVSRILTGGVSGIFESKDQRKKTTGQMVKDTKEAYKVVSNAIKRSVFGVPILAYMALLRINLFGQAAQMYPGLLTEQQAREKGYNIANWKKAVKLIEKVQKGLAKFGSDAPGDVKLFKDAVRMGHDKPPFRSRKKAAKDKAKAEAMAANAKKTAASAAKATPSKPKLTQAQLAAIVAKNNNFSSADNVWSNVEGVWEAAAIAVGSAVIGIVADLVKKSGVKSNPYDPGKEPAGFIPDDGGVEALATPEQQNQAIRDEIMNNPNYSPEQKQQMLANVDGAVDELNAAVESGEDDTMTYVLIGGAGLVAIGLLVWIFKPKTA